MTRRPARPARRENLLPPPAPERAPDAEPPTGGGSGAGEQPVPGPEATRPDPRGQRPSPATAVATLPPARVVREAGAGTADGTAPAGSGQSATAGSVSSTSAARFAARVRRRRHRRWGSAAGVLALLALLGWVLLGSPWLRVTQVQVSGVSRIPTAEVLAAAAGQRGRPILLADTSAVAAQVRQDRRAVRVTVTRSWPSTLVVDVTERVPVAAVPSGAAFRLVDVDGVTVQDGVPRPSDLPVLQVDLVTAGPKALSAALAVGQSLPQDLRSAVRQIGATSVDDVWLTLRSGAKVTWGDAGRTAEKVTVLQALRTAEPKARSYDVQVPEHPVYVRR